MSKFSLTISENYCGNWTIWEICREIISNALDAQDKGSKMELEFKDRTLKVTSKGVKLSPSVWLMGQTSKAGDKQQRGQFGEGIKLAALAAVREGYGFHIINSDETWHPALEESPVFAGAKVLTVTCDKLEKPLGDFTVIISGISNEMWDTISSRFLDIGKPQESLKTGSGTIIGDLEQAGNLYVRGVFVQKDPEFKYSYDFKNVSIDRDRKMIDGVDARCQTASCWETAAEASPSYVEHIMVLLEMGAKDVAALQWCTKSLGLKIVEYFKNKHGSNAMAVRTAAEALEVGHYGKTGVVLPNIYVTILERFMGTLATHMASYAASVEMICSIEDLDDQEKKNWFEALQLVEMAAIVVGFEPLAGRTEIVEFKSKTLNGLHQNQTKIIQIGRHLLKTPSELRRVLVHELAHDAAPDGDKLHEVSEGKLHTEIQTQLLDQITRLTGEKTDEIPTALAA